MDSDIIKYLISDLKSIDYESHEFTMSQIDYETRIQ